MLAVRGKPVRHRAGWICRHRAGPLQFCTCSTQRSGQSQHREPFTPGERIPPEHPTEQVQRRRKPRAAEERTPSVLIDVWDGKRLLHVDTVHRTNSTQELERCAIAAEKDVLAVVDKFSRFTIAKRGRSSSQLRARVGNENAVPSLRQRRGSAEARETAPNNRDRIRLSPGRLDSVRNLRVVESHHAPSVVRTQVIAAIIARSGLGIRTTRENTS